MGLACIGNSPIITTVSSMRASACSIPPLPYAMDREPRNAEDRFDETRRALGVPHEQVRANSGIPRASEHGLVPFYDMAYILPPTAAEPAIDALRSIGRRDSVTPFASTLANG